MENASKALLIAGAILLVIAIIAIGVGIVSSTRGTIDSAGVQIDSMAIQMHNKMLQKYEGKNVSYEQVKEYVTEIVAYNSTVKQNDFQVRMRGGKYQTSGSRFICGHNYLGEESYKSLENCVYLDNSNVGRIYEISVSYNQNGIINEVHFVRLGN